MLTLASGKRNEKSLAVVKAGWKTPTRDNCWLTSSSHDYTHTRNNSDLVAGVRTRDIRIYTNFYEEENV